MVDLYNTILLKPGVPQPPAPTITVHDKVDFDVHYDNAIILCVPKCNKYGKLTIAGGDGPMASGDLDIWIPPDEDTYLYLESGRYARHENGKLVISMWAEDDFPAHMILLG